FRRRRLHGGAGKEGLYARGGAAHGSPPAENGRTDRLSHREYAAQVRRGRSLQQTHRPKLRRQHREREHGHGIASSRFGTREWESLVSGSAKQTGSVELSRTS